MITSGLGRVPAPNVRVGMPGPGAGRAVDIGDCDWERNGWERNGWERSGWERNG
jgi:hypothetical protein